MSTYDKLVGATPEGLLPPAVLAHLSTPENAPTGSVSTVEYWVSPTGDDAAAGTNAAPWKTVARAVQSIPDVIRAGHTHTITLMAGAWDEQLAVQNKTIAGQLIVQGATEDRYAHTIRDAYTINVQGHFTIRNIHSSKLVPGVHFRFHGSGPRMEVFNCSGTGEVTEEPFSSGNQGVLADYGSSVIVEDSKFDYKDYGIRSNYGSVVVSRNNSGAGNTHGVGARFGGRVGLHGKQPAGYDGMAAFASGGLIAHETGGVVGVQRYNQALDKLDTLGLVDQLTFQAQGNAAPVKRWLSRASTTREGSVGAGGTNIPDGSTLRFHFQMTTTTSCPMVVEVTASWTPTGLSGSRFAKAVMVGTVTQTAVTSAATTVLAQVGGADAFSVKHSGANGLFYIDFKPLGGANNGNHGVNIEISNMKHLDAPIMLGAEVVSV